MANPRKPAAPRKGRAVAAFTGRRKSYGVKRTAATATAARRRYGTTKSGSAGSY